MNKVNIEREEINGYEILIADGELSCVLRRTHDEPLVEGTPDEIREHCRTH
ncbi:hypothetical protein [Streptomyces montanus]|uniref:hypothetical protein n=1 Tax=Streptomyces montanus TaxID=2580423 RepID=UPI001486E659|nr:hypothetical protein [Streptomyces montanus]